MVIRNIQYYLLFVCFIWSINGQAQELNEFDVKAESSVQLQKELVSAVDSYQKLYNTADSIQSDSLPEIKKHIVTLLTGISDLDKNNFNSLTLSDEDVLTGNNRILQIVENIKQHCGELINSNIILLKEVAVVNRPDSISHISHNIIENHKNIHVGVQIFNDLKSKRKDALKLFNKPINLDGISEFYKIDSPKLQMLLGKRQSGNDKSKDKVEVVVKGYSPFSNVYKEFVFFADSLKNKEQSKILNDTLIKEKPDYMVSVPSNKENELLTDLGIVNK